MIISFVLKLEKHLPSKKMNIQSDQYALKYIFNFPENY